MVERPPIIFIPAHSQNINTRPAGVRYEALVVHTTAGGSTIEQLGAWFGGGNIAAGLRGSTHFGVDRTGRIGQFVDLSQQPIAHGQESGSTAKLVRDNPGVSANAWAIGVEHLDAGSPGSVTPAQVEASAWLMAWLWETVIAPHAATTGAVLDRDHLLQHRDLAPVSKPLCASWPEVRMVDHIARIGARLNPPPQPPVIDWRAFYLDELHGQIAGGRDDATRAAVRIETATRKLSEVQG